MTVVAKLEPRVRHSRLSRIPDPPCAGCVNQVRCGVGLLACYKFAVYVSATPPEIWAWKYHQDTPNPDIYAHIYSGDDNE